MTVKQATGWDFLGATHHDRHRGQRYGDGLHAGVFPGLCRLSGGSLEKGQNLWQGRV